MASESPSPHHVLIAGGGVAGLEALLALRDLAGDRLAVTLLAPEREFTYRPMAVAVPFARGHMQRRELADVTGDAGAGPGGVRRAAGRPGGGIREAGRLRGAAGRGVAAARVRARADDGLGRA